MNALITVILNALKKGIYSNLILDIWTELEGALKKFPIDLIR